MTTITTRSGKGSPLTNNEVDANFTNLNDDKVEASGDSMTGNLSFGDNNKVILGSGNDLQIYHDGSASYVEDAGTGNLRLKTNGVGLQILDGSDLNLALFNAGNGQSYLYNVNGGVSTQRLATTTTGIDVTGTITFDGGTTTANVNFGDNDKAVFGAGSDLQIYHDGSNSYIKDAGTGDLYIQGEANVRITDGDGNKMFLGQNDGEVQLYYNGSEKFHTTNTGVNVIGTVTSDGLTVENDSGSITIENDASNRNQRLRRNASNSLILDKYNGTTTTNTAKFDENGDISFYEDTGTTAKLFWDASAERLGIGSSSPAATLDVVRTGAGIQDTLQLRNAQTLAAGVGSSLGFGDSGGARLAYIAGAATGSNNDNGYLSFYTRASDSLAEKMRIDSSGNVGIGTSSPAANVEISGTGEPSLKITDTGDNKAFSMMVSPAWATDSLVFLDASAGTARMVINDTGNVGIGTLSPSNLLDVTGSIAGDYAAAFENTNSTNGYGVLAKTAHTGTSAFAFGAYGGSNALMVVRGDGNVGIGTSSPATRLHSVGAEGEVARIGSGSVAFSLGVGHTGNGTGYLNLFPISSPSTSPTSLAFQMGGTERMRIDSSGNVLVGKTNTTFSTSGIELRAGNGGSRFIRSNAEPVLMNRTGSNGKVLGVYKDGTEVGSIGTDGGDMYLGTGITGVIFNDANNAILPYRTNAEDDANIDIGHSNYRFQDLYLSGNAYADNFIGTDDGDTFIAMTGSNVMRFFTGNSERARLDASGNLLVGKTAIDFGTVGAEILPTGVIRSAVGGGHCLMANRKDSDGEIINLRKDNTTVGSIQSRSGAVTTMVFDPRSNGSGITGTTNGLLPTNQAGTPTNNHVDLGSDSNKFKDLYLSGGTYITGSVPRLQFNDTDGTNTQGEIRQLSDAIIIKSRNGTSNGVIRFSGENGTTESEYARFDSSGILLVGKTAVSGSTAGIQMKPAGELSVVRDANHAFILNRLSSDGNIALFQKDGTTIGVIQAYYGDMKLGTGDTGLIFGDGQDAIYPATTVTAASRDAAIDLGLSTARYKDLYLSGNITLGSASQINASSALYLDTDIHVFRANNETEKARIDSSGNLLVGKTFNDNSTVGGSIRAGESSFVSGTLVL